MRFNFDDYAHDQRYVMHCPTTEEAKIFLSHLKEIGKTWCTGQDYLTDNLIEPSYLYFYFVTGHRGSSFSSYSPKEFLLNFYDFEWGDDEPVSIEISLDDLF